MPLVLQQMIYSDQSRPKKVKWNTLIIHLQWILRLSTNPNGSPSQPDHSAWHTTKNKNSGGAWQRAQGINLASWQTDSWVATQRTQRIHHQRPGVGHNRTPQVIQCPGWLNECQDPKSPCRSLQCNAKNYVIHITWQSFYCFDRSVYRCSSLFFRTVLHTQKLLSKLSHTHTVLWPVARHTCSLQRVHGGSCCICCLGGETRWCRHTLEDMNPPERYYQKNLESSILCGEILPTRGWYVTPAVWTKSEEMIVIDLGLSKHILTSWDVLRGGSEVGFGSVGHCLKRLISFCSALILQYPGLLEILNLKSFSPWQWDEMVVCVFTVVRRKPDGFT